MDLGSITLCVAVVLGIICWLGHHFDPVRERQVKRDWVEESDE